MADLLESPDDDLYAAIGEYLVQKSVGARPPTRSQIIARGKEWASKFHAEFHKALCESKLVGYARNNPSGTAIILAAVASTLTKLNAIDVESEGGDKALMSLAALIVKVGIDKYCGPGKPNKGAKRRDG
ncbi:hypothetical protein [Bradyrhizobium brasilense]|uniref:hypothetical protein n=1 Tax=Bradyrhizobium brasilense TaxID=1419277 RepID=UPI001E2BD65D|nr:hypothetical protein [Bradyrhizobium brasilense]MCC8968907.1 hypothetical protein [Bradyrhizobium brasilense]